MGPQRPLPFWILFLPLLISQAPALPADPWALPAWSSRIHLTNFNLATPGSLNNFPVLVRLTNVTALSTARADGGDLTFVDPNGAQLFHEIESFNQAAGDLLAWVCVPTLTNQTRFYLYWSNSGANLTFAGSNTYSSLSTSLPSLATNLISTNVWDPNFKLVYHFSETSGSPKDSGRYAIAPSSVGISNRPGTNGPLGNALATSFPTKNNSSNTTPVLWGTNKMGVSPVSVSYSMWVNYNAPSPAYVGSNEFLELLSFYGGGSYSGVLCVRMDSNNSATMTTYQASAAMSKFTNFGNWNFVAGGGTLVNYIVGSPTNGTNWGMTNGVTVAQNTSVVTMISNNSPASSLVLGAYPNAGYYHPSGGYDEFRLSYSNRETTWMRTEYSNAMQPANQVLADGPEFAVNPTLLSPSTSLVTNMTLTFSWTPGSAAGLSNLVFSSWSNGQPWLSQDMGTNLSLTLALSSVFGPISSNQITWWVTANLSNGNSYSSLSNSFIASLALKARVQGTVYGTANVALSNVVVQSSALPGSYLLTDGSGRFDLGPLLVNRTYTLILTPPGRYGVQALSTNVTLGLSDVDLPYTLQTGATNAPAVVFNTTAPIFVAGNASYLQLLIPLQWTDYRRVQVYAVPLAGGRRSLLYDAGAAPTDRMVLVAKEDLQRSLKPGPHILEFRLTAQGQDEASALLARQLFFYAQ